MKRIFLKFSVKDLVENNQILNFSVKLFIVCTFLQSLFLLNSPRAHLYCKNILRACHYRNYPKIKTLYLSLDFFTLAGNVGHIAMRMEV